MRKLARSLILGASLALLASVATAQSMPSQQWREVMIKTMLVTFNDANLTNNYEVFHTLMSKALADAYTPAQFADAFVSFRDEKIDLGVVTAYPPVEEPAPFVDADSILHLKGYFETSPNYVAYDMEFAGDESGEWKLTGINVQVAPPADLGLSAAGDGAATEPAPSADTPPADTPPADGKQKFANH